MMRARAAATALATSMVVAGWLSPAGAATEVPGDAEYRGKGTQIVTVSDGSAVTLEKLPITIKCKGVTPTNLGEDLGPFPIKANGSFSNGVKKVKAGSGDVAVSGRFASDGRSVSGKVEQAAFKDDAKDFDCPAFEGSFKAKLVKGTGLRPGQVLARDTFSEADSGFAAFNEQNSFGEFLGDGRFRVGLRGPGAVFALRDEPEASTVDVTAVARWYGNDQQDAAGLVCQASGDDSSFSVGLVRMNGQVELKRYVEGEIFESAPPAALDTDRLKKEPGAAIALDLACVPEPDGQGTSMTLSVNGVIVHTAKTSGSQPGKTGLFVEDQAGGADFNFEDFEVTVPERD